MRLHPPRHCIHGRLPLARCQKHPPRSAVRRDHNALLLPRPRHARVSSKNDAIHRLPPAKRTAILQCKFPSPIPHIAPSRTSRPGRAHVYQRTRAEGGSVAGYGPDTGTDKGKSTVSELSASGHASDDLAYTGHLGGSSGDERTDI